MGLTKVSSDGIEDGSIVNADLHNAAAIKYYIICLMSSFHNFPTILEAGP